MCIFRKVTKNYGVLIDSLILLLHLLNIFCRDERRIRKWRKMIGVGGSDWKQYVRRKPHVVKRRIRKGIPDCLRGLLWQLISGSRDLLLLNPGVYEVGVNFCLVLFFFVVFWKKS